MERLGEVSGIQLGETEDSGDIAGSRPDKSVGRIGINICKHFVFLFQTMNDPAPRGRSPAELNGKATLGS